MVATTYSKACTSSDGGASWTEASVASFEGVAVSPDRSKMAGVVHGGNIWISNDGGASWVEDTSVGSTKSWVRIAMSGDGSKMVVVVQFGNIWTSNDGGASWTEDSSVGSTQQWRDVAMSADGSKVVAAVKIERRHMDEQRWWRKLWSVDLDIQRVAGCWHVRWWIPDGGGHVGQDLDQPRWYLG